MASFPLTVLPGTFAICRLGANDRVPAWAADAFSITRTDEELSIVCAAGQVPEGVVAQKDWRVLKVEGPLDFALTGILHELTRPLAEARISIFAVSTYDTDYILIKAADLERAVSALRSAGNTVNT